MRAQKYKKWPLGHVSCDAVDLEPELWVPLPSLLPLLFLLIAGRLPSRLCLHLLVPGLPSPPSFCRLSSPLTKSRCGESHWLGMLSLGPSSFLDEYRSASAVASAPAWSLRSCRSPQLSIATTRLPGVMQRVKANPGTRWRQRPKCHHSGSEVTPIKCVGIQ